ncbi:hypothetical protein NDU88_002160 [Pleurodeles waltl]|uniref:Uncharacterized protein n=1 Tax=Pleurodeles waltl TaxID=8319 RepID=A0AAV7T1R6_PLEWA|nr:hypothetical protein NDU88_002160 [Pleurodeles waltl]
MLRCANLSLNPLTPLFLPSCPPKTEWQWDCGAMGLCRHTRWGRPVCGSRASLIPLGGTACCGHATSSRLRSSEGPRLRGTAVPPRHRLAVLRASTVRPSSVERFRFRFTVASHKSKTSI